MLDHIWTSSQEYIKQSGVVKTDISDHYMVYAVHRHKTNYQQGDQQYLTIQYRSFKNFDQDAYEIDLQSADWSTVYSAQTTDEAWDISSFNS